MGLRKKNYREEDDSSTASSSSLSSLSCPSSQSDSEEIDKQCLKKRHRRRNVRRSHRSSGSKKKTSRYLDSGSSTDKEPENSGLGHGNPEEVVKGLLEEFPGVAGDLKQILQMIDDGQAVDINALADKSLLNHLEKLFLSLNLEESGDKIFLLPPKVKPTLGVILPIIQNHKLSQKEERDPASQNNVQSPSHDLDDRQERDDVDINNVKGDVHAPRRKVIGPEMPSADLLNAAARSTEAEDEMSKAELGDDDKLFVGPLPPAVVNEVQSSNEAERFEEVTRIMEVEDDSPYDILGVNKNTSDDKMKKRYWKLSLMVHPDKCTHPQAQQAFIKLNKAHEYLKDADKRKALDEKINLKEKEEKRKAELKAMHEAALGRRSQGISMEGDDILLAGMKVGVGPKRDEWMTMLPPERKPYWMPMHSTTFSWNFEEWRRDASAWTDIPMQHAQKAKMNYCKAYNEATPLASNEEDKALVDQYNKVKRSKTLVEQDRESTQDHSKKQTKQEPINEEWEGSYPWKPWDREKDLTAGKKSVKLDPGSMSHGLTSRFASGSFQRSFL